MFVAGLLLMVNIGGNKKFTFLFLNQNICCGCSKETSQCSFEHPKQMSKWVDKKIFTILHSNPAPI